MFAFPRAFTDLPPVFIVPSTKGDDNLFLEPSTSMLKPKSASRTVKSGVVPSKIPVTKTLPATVPSQRFPTTRTRPTIVSTSRTGTTSATRSAHSANATRTVPTTTITKTRQTTASRLTNVTKPALIARPVRSSATTKAISPRKQAIPRATTSRVQPMKPLVLAQKSNTTGSSSTTRSGIVSRPPSSAMTRKAISTVNIATGKKFTGTAFKEKEGELILEFDVEVEIEEFRFDV